MAEYRRYVGRNLERARERLRADSEQLAARGLRPTWTLWVRHRRGWLPRRGGELLVRLEPALDREATISALLAPLSWKMRSLMTAHDDASRYLGSLTPSVAGDDTPAATERRRELEGFRHRVDVLTRELHLELIRLESLCDR